MMTEQELNRWAYKILGGCQGFIVVPYGVSGSGTIVCEHGGPRKHQIPDYCNDLNAAALIEAETIKKVGHDDYEATLLDVVLGTKDESLITASAKSKVTACYKAWTENKNDV